MINLALLKPAIDLPAIARRAGIDLRPQGPDFLALCPFHAERSPSFYIHPGRDGFWFKCHGCDAKGDAIKFYQLLNNCDFKTATAELAAQCGIGPEPEEKKTKGKRPKAKLPEKPPAPAPQPAILPPLRQLSPDSRAELAALRGLSEAAIHAACLDGLLYGQVIAMSHYGFPVWGQQIHDLGNRHGLRMGPQRCWILTDRTGLVAQIRRMDGQPFPRKDGTSYKANTIGTSKWPVGASHIGTRPTVHLVEGGPDILGAYHILLEMYGPTAPTRHAVVGLLGAATSVLPHALPHFTGKHLRIYPHADETRTLKNGRETNPGLDGAAKWATTLGPKAASLVAVDLADLRQHDGTAVKDLCDLCHASQGWFMSPEAGEMFPAEKAKD